MTTTNAPISVIASDRAVTVVRAPRPFDVAALATDAVAPRREVIERLMSSPDEHWRTTAFEPAQA